MMKTCVYLDYSHVDDDALVFMIKHLEHVDHDDAIKYPPKNQFLSTNKETRICCPFFENDNLDVTPQDLWWYTVIFFWNTRM